MNNQWATLQTKINITIMGLLSILFGVPAFAAYDVENGSEIFSEINDSIRNNMPDTTDFELFLIKLTEDEVGIDAYVPNNKQLMEELACVFMNTEFSRLVPKNRKIRIYSYTNPDGSGDSPFEAGIKNNTHNTL